MAMNEPYTEDLVIEAMRAAWDEGRGGGRTAKELAHLVGRSQAAVGEALRTLRRRGLAVVHAHGRRGNTWAPSCAGRIEELISSGPVPVAELVALVRADGSFWGSLAQVVADGRAVEVRSRRVIEPR